MKKDVFMYLAVAALLFVGCSKTEQEHPVPSGKLSNVPVKLSGVINEGGTRAPVTGTTPASDLELSIFRADATTDKTYATTYTSKLDGTFKPAEQSLPASVEMSPAQYYLVDGTRYTKFIAVYPRVDDAQYAPDAGTVDYTIDGETDIMTGTLVEGNKLEPVPAMAFTHKLTQVKVKVKAVGTDAERTALDAAWGKVIGITLTGKAVTAVVTLPNPNSGVTSIAAKTEPAPTALALIKDAAVGNGLSLSDAAADFGYAMFLPVTTEAPLQLNITTETTGTTPKQVSTSPQTFDEGNIYTITIEFKINPTGGPDAQVVSVTSTGSMTDWNTTPGPITGELY
jgi:hypothetical protein